MIVADEVQAPSLALTTARYRTQLTPVPPDGTTVQRLLKADARRWYVEFWSRSGAATMARPLPGPMPDVPVTFGVANSPQVYKWRDAPSMVQGEWFSAGTDADGWLVVECLYLG